MRITTWHPCGRCTRGVPGLESFGRLAVILSANASEVAGEERDFGWLLDCFHACAGDIATALALPWSAESQASRVEVLCLIV